MSPTRSEVNYSETAKTTTTKCSNASSCSMPSPSDVSKQPINQEGGSPPTTDQRSDNLTTVSTFEETTTMSGGDELSSAAGQEDETKLLLPTAESPIAHDGEQNLNQNANHETPSITEAMYQTLDQWLDQVATEAPIIMLPRSFVNQIKIFCLRPYSLGPLLQLIESMPSPGAEDALADETSGAHLQPNSPNGRHRLGHIEEEMANLNIDQDMTLDDAPLRLVQKLNEFDEEPEESGPSNDDVSAEVLVNGENDSAVVPCSALAVGQMLCALREVLDAEVARGLEELGHLPEEEEAEARQDHFKDVVTGQHADRDVQRGGKLQEIISRVYNETSDSESDSDDSVRFAIRTGTPETDGGEEADEDTDEAEEDGGGFSVEDERKSKSFPNYDPGIHWMDAYTQAGILSADELEKENSQRAANLKSRRSEEDEDSEDAEVGDESSAKKAIRLQSIKMMKERYQERAVITPSSSSGPSTSSGCLRRSTRSSSFILPDSPDSLLDETFLEDYQDVNITKKKKKPVATAKASSALSRLLSETINEEPPVVLGPMTPINFTGCLNRRGGLSDEDEDSDNQLDHDYTGRGGRNSRGSLPGTSGCRSEGTVPFNPNRPCASSAPICRRRRFVQPELVPGRSLLHSSASDSIIVPDMIFSNSTSTVDGDAVPSPPPPELPSKAFGKRPMKRQPLIRPKTPLVPPLDDDDEEAAEAEAIELVLEMSAKEAAYERAMSGRAKKPTRPPPSIPVATSSTSPIDDDTVDMSDLLIHRPSSGGSDHGPPPRMTTNSITIIDMDDEEAWRGIPSISGTQKVKPSIHDIIPGYPGAIPHSKQRNYAIKAVVGQKRKRELTFEMLDSPSSMEDNSEASSFKSPPPPPPPPPRAPLPPLPPGVVNPSMIMSPSLVANRSQAISPNSPNIRHTTTNESAKVSSSTASSTLPYTPHNLSQANEWDLTMGHWEKFSVAFAADVPPINLGEALDIWKQPKAFELESKRQYQITLRRGPEKQVGVQRIRVVVALEFKDCSQQDQAQAIQTWCFLAAEQQINTKKKPRRANPRLFDVTPFGTGAGIETFEFDSDNQMHRLIWTPAGATETSFFIEFNATAEHFQPFMCLTTYPMRLVVRIERYLPGGGAGAGAGTRINASCLARLSCGIRILDDKKDKEKNSDGDHQAPPPPPPEDAA